MKTSSPVKYPIGAIKSVRELQAKCVLGDTVYVNRPQSLHPRNGYVAKHILSNGFGYSTKIPFEDTEHDYIALNALPCGYSYYSIKGELCLPLVDGEVGFIFTNYWLAYAHALRERQRCKSS
jgi:hypothetical protein